MRCHHDEHVKDASECEEEIFLGFSSDDETLKPDEEEQKFRRLDQVRNAS